MLGLGLSLQKGISAFNAGRALVSSYIRRVTEAGGVLQNTACDAAAINELNQDRLLEPASWVLVPDGIKEDVVFAQKPTSGLGDLTFTRASDATYTDSTGVIRRSPYNFFQFSEMFSDASWVKVRSTITANTVNAPNGTLTADTITCTETGTNGCFIRQSVSLANERTTSIYVKPNTAEYFQIHRDFGSGVVFNLTNGTVKESVGATGTITAQADGWYRCTATFSASGLSLFLVGNSSMTVATWFSTINQSLYLWGAQFVEGTSALDYFPTTNRQDVPRIDFRNADGTLSSCGRLLLEPQTTALNQFSEQIDNAYWAKTNCSVTANQTASPSGYVDAELILDNTSNSQHAISTTISVTSGNKYTASFFLKEAGYTTAAIRMGVGSLWTGGGGPTVEFDLTALTGTIVDGSGVTFTIEDYGNGWRRCSVTGTCVTSGGTAYSLYVKQYAGYIGNGTSGIYAWGANLTATGYIQSYIPTLAATVTRVADACSKTGISSLIGQTEGTLFYEFSVPLNESSTRSIGVNDGTISNRINISVFATALFARVDVGGVNQVNSSATIVPTAMNKVAFRYKANDFAAYVNGVKVITDTSGSTFSGNTLSSFSFIQPDGTSAFNGNVGQIAFFKTALTDDQLEVLTSEGYGNYALLAQSLNYVLQ